MARKKKVSTKARLPQLWEGAKYISWNVDHVNPIVRVPRKKGGIEQKTIIRFEHESEYDLFSRCVEYRDFRGRQLWGQRRWAQILEMPIRIVARQPENQAGPKLGVRHYTRKGVGVWAVYWNERLPCGTTKQRSKHFSYGGKLSRYTSSDGAMEAAISVRNEKEAFWYSTADKS